mmetsp:Transcript_12857/g.32907  ORF Transcript_12857/g.32907 Transcript_12857/m.32907 type:complete len:210 (+) Transcript_12857:183-812(+)
MASIPLEAATVRGPARPQARRAANKREHARVQSIEEAAWGAQRGEGATSRPTHDTMQQGGSTRDWEGRAGGAPPSCGCEERDGRLSRIGRRAGGLRLERQRARAQARAERFMTRGNGTPARGTARGLRTQSSSLSAYRAGAEWVWEASSHQARSLTRKSHCSLRHDVIHAQSPARAAAPVCLAVAHTVYRTTSIVPIPEIYRHYLVIAG